MALLGTDCIGGPPLSEPLIGQVVLEELDLFADCTTGNSSHGPNSPITPLLKLK